MMAAVCGSAAALCALADGVARQEGDGRALDVNAVATGGRFAGKTALDLALGRKQAEVAAILCDEMGALCAVDVEGSDSD